MDSTTLAGLEFDLYEVLEVDPSSSLNEIKKAYRKKALQCHPDKNPDNPDAAAEFHKLTRILTILSDDNIRQAYDRILKGRKEAALRDKQLDTRRKKFKEDLESRENLAQSQQANSTKSSKQQLEAEIERLRKEGSQALEDEIRSVTNQMKDECNRGNRWDGSKYRIKIKWKAARGDASNGGYTKDLLLKFLSKYGEVAALVISSKKNGSAMVEFEERSAAELAVQLEKGLSSNPLTLNWVNGPPPVSIGLGFLVKGTEFDGMTMEELTQPDIRKRFIEKIILEKF